MKLVSKLAFLAALALTGACTINSTTTTTGDAYRPENDPAYVSPLQYSHYSCNQLHTALDLTSHRIDQSMAEDERQNNTQAALDTALSAYALAEGQGYNPPHHEHHHDSVELRRLKNEYAAIEQTAIEKNCITVQ